MKKMLILALGCTLVGVGTCFGCETGTFFGKLVVTKLAERELKKREQAKEEAKA